MQSARDDAHGLELSSRIADSFLIYGESLREELVCDLLEAGLVGYLAAANEEAETEIGSTVTGVEGGNGRVHEFVQGGGLRGPVVVVMFSGFVFSSELDGRCEDGGGGEFDAFVAVGEGFAGGLEEFELGVVVGTLDEVDNPRQPALLYDRLIGLGTSSLAGHSGVACRLLHALFYQNPYNFQNAVEMLRG